MTTAFAPGRTMQRTANTAHASHNATTLSARFRAAPMSFRRAATTPNAARGTCITPLAYRGSGSQQWGGRQRRGSWGPMMWQFGNPAAQATLEDLAREFGFSVSSGGCDPGRSRAKGGMWADFVNQASLPLDFEELDASYVVTADVPGLQKSDLKITVNKDERSLTVSGERRRPAAEGGETAAEDGQRRRQRLERRMGKFERVVPGLPEDADLSSVAARVEKGVLAITIKKIPEVQQPDNTIDIDIE